MKRILLVFGLMYHVTATAQHTAPKDITPDTEGIVKEVVKTETDALRSVLQKRKINPVQIEFIADTFYIEHLMAGYIEIDYRDFSMQETAYKGAKLYDSLLNKYYKKLLSVLKGNDKKILTQAQKSWIIFRDSETTLVETISKDDYSGGGTLQDLTAASLYLSLIKRRTIDIYDHWIRATQNQ